MSEAPAIPYEQRKNDPEFPHIGFRIRRDLAERFWRMARVRNQNATECFIDAVEALAREMNATKAAAE